MNEVKIGTIGGVNASKTTTTSVLINKILDDGNGAARAKILQHPHEKESGRTSSITENYLYINDKKYITFVDLAGHEKYLKTTIHGLAGQHIDYSLIFVGGNMGVSVMTREHLILSVTLRIPFIFVVSKIDIAPKNILKETIDNITSLVKKMGIKQCNPVLVDEETDLDKIDMKTMYPIFCTSNKTGQGVDKLRDFVVNLNCRFQWCENDDTKFVVSHRYNVKGIGTVFSGKLVSGVLKKNDKLLLGPFHGNWVNVVARSLHNNFRNNVEQLVAGESGCIAVNSKTELNKNKLRRGMILINKDNPNAISTFEADIAILTKHSTTIRKGYSPIINCNMISQTAKIVDICDNQDVIRCGDKAKVKFEFMYRPEMVNEGDRIIFRDGRTKGFGQITKVY